jgi:hypothetical protein
VAVLRAREGLRGPVLVFLGLFLAGAAAAALLTPGEPGLDRQRAVDAYVLDVARYVSALAAIVLAAASLSGDREARRAPLLRATPLRDAELLLGGLLGHAACVLALLLGIFLGALSVTAHLAGGPRDRVVTRERLSAVSLAGGKEQGDWVFLTEDAPEAVYEVDPPREDLPFDAEPEGVKAWIRLREILDLGLESVPETYPVGLRLGSGPERVLQVTHKTPVRFTLTADHFRDGPLRIRVRRMHPAFVLGLHREGLAIQGRPRSFALNLGKALGGWFLALLPLLATAALLSVAVGAPVAVAGTLFLLLLGLSHGLIDEAAWYAKKGMLPITGYGRGALAALGLLIPDFAALDFSLQVAERWDIGLRYLAEQVPGALLATMAPLAVAWGLLFVVRRAT